MFHVIVDITWWFWAQNAQTPKYLNTLSFSSFCEKRLANTLQASPRRPLKLVPNSN